MDELLYKLEKQANELSELEKVVFKFMKSSPETFVNGTLDQISGITYVSTATISRTIKKVGFKNFQELKFVFLQELRNNSKLSNQSLDATSFQNSIIEKIEATFDFLEESNFEVILDQIHKANNIEIYSVGSSLTIGIDLSRKLLSLGKNANAYVDWDDLSRKSKIQKTSELAILISLSGETKHIIEYATNLSENKVTMIGIIGTADSRLEEKVDHCIYAPSIVKYYKEADISSRVAMVAIIEYLTIKYSEFV